MRYILAIYLCFLCCLSVSAADPVVVTLAKDSTVACGTADVEVIFTQWYESAGGAVATDPDGGAIIYAANISQEDAFTIFEQSSDTLCGPTMSVTLDFQAVDEEGISVSVGTATFATADVTDPVVTQIPSFITYECQEGIQDTLETWIKNRGGAVAMDACSSVRWTTFIYNDTDGNSGVGSIENGPYPEISGFCMTTINISFVVVDECNNQRATTGSFTIIDDTPPIFSNVLEDITVSCDNVPNTDDVEVSDFCDPNFALDVEDISSQSSTPDQCSFYNYTITRIYTAEDACGNIAKDTTLINVADLGPPIINGQDTVQISCEDFADGDTIMIVAIDDCSESIIEYTDTPYTPSCSTTVDRSYTVSDICGNEVNFVQHFIIEDTTPPTFVSLPLSESVACTATDVDQLFQAWLQANLAIGVADGCTSSEMFAATPGTYDLEDETTYPGQPVGAFDISTCPSAIEGLLRSETVDFVAYDPCGNAVVHQATFGISDETAPVIANCYEDIEIVIEDGLCTSDVTLPALEISDDCDEEYVSVLRLNNTLEFPLQVSASNTIEGLEQGDYQAEIIVTDCAGNQAICQFTIDIVDDQDPIFEDCPPLEISAMVDSDCTYSYLLPAADFSISDNCDLGKVYEQKRPSLASNELLTFSDDGTSIRIGNETFSFDQVFPVLYSDRAVILQVAITANTVGADDIFTVFGENGYELGTTSIGDACQQNTYSFTIPVEVYNTWLSDDEVDISLIASPNNTIQPCDVLQANGTDGISRVSLNLSYSDAEIEYEVSGATTIGRVSYVLEDSVELNVGVNTITYYASDLSGNEATCENMVTIADETAPTASCKNAVINVYPDGEVLTTIETSLIDDGSFDICSQVTLEVFPKEVSCDQVGSDIEVKLFVSDVSGNVDSCTALVKVEAFELMPSFSAGICQDDTLKLFSNVPPPSTPGSYTYQWTGPGFSSMEANPFILDADAGDNGTYTVEVTGFNGCITVGSVQVNIPQLTTPEIMAESDTICIGDDLVLSATAFTGNITYEWYEGVAPNEMLIETTTTPSLILTPTEGSHFYSVVALSDDCTSNRSSLLSTLVIETPIAQVDDNFINVCEENSFSLGTPTFGAGFQYAWTGPNGYSSDKPLPELITHVTDAEAGEYSLVISVGSCMSDTAVTRVNVFDKPATPIITSGETFCEGSTVSLTVNNIPNADLYTWYLDGQVYITEGDNSLVITNGQTSISGSWQVSVEDGICLSDTSEAQNIVIEDLQDLSVTNSGPVCDGDSIQLFVSFVAGAEYLWSGPNGFESTLQNPKLIAIAGEYTVEIVTGTNCETSTSTTVEVNTAPIITALSNNSTACMDGETNIVFFPTVVPNSGNFTYQWSGPNGFVSDLLNPTLVNPTEADNGTYILTVQNENCSSQPIESIVDITITPDQPAITIPSAACQGEDVTLIVEDEGSGVTYIWNTPSTTINTTEPSLTITNVNSNSEGEYSVSIDKNGCLSVVSEPVDLIVSPLPTAPIFTSNSPVCFGEDIVLTITNPDTEANYSWEGPMGLIGSGPVLVVQGSDDTEGLYRVMIRKDGCPSPFSTDQIVEVREEIKTPIAEQTSYDLCIGISSSIEICLDQGSAEPSATYTLINVNNGTTVASGNSICFLIADLTVFEQGTNFLYIEAMNNGCSSARSEQFRVELSNVPTVMANIIESDMLLCEDEAFLLTAQHGPPLVDVVWSSSGNIDFSDENENMTSVSGFESGETEIYLSYSQNACVDYSIDTLIVELASEPILSDDSYETASNEPISLDVLENDDLPEDFTISVVDQPQIGKAEVDGDEIIYTPDDVISGTVTFTYEVCNAECPDNCAEADVTILVQSNGDCIASTIITPNDDNINDNFEVTCLDGNNFPDNKITVFNQWGDEVFSAQNYDNSWSGTYESKPLPAGTYFYILDLADGQEPLHSFLIIQR